MSERTGSLQIKINLRDIRPPVWRRVVVPADITLGQLHRVIQNAMGWWDYHLHAFDIGDKHYGVPDPEDWIPTIDESRVQLRRAAEVGQSFRYTYDFGDDWEHDIVIEKPLTDPIDVPRCIAGRMACPPEDVGSTPGYANFLEAISNPAHPEHAEYLEWIGRPFDPAAFDIDEINEALRTPNADGDDVAATHSPAKVIALHR